MDPRFHDEMRLAAKDREPGQVSEKLRRRMGPELADIFDSFGPETYSSVVLAIKDVLKENLESGIAGVEAEVKEELGRRGVEEAREHFRAWMDEFVDDVIKSGMDEASVTVEEIGDSLVADFTAEGDEGDDLLDMGDEFEEVEEIEEEDVEPEPEPEESEEDLFAEEGGEMEPLALDLEELDLDVPEEEGAAAGLGRGRFRRPAPRRRFRGAAPRREAQTRGGYEVLTFRNGRPRFV